MQKEEEKKVVEKRRRSVGTEANWLLFGVFEQDWAGTAWKRRRE